MDEQQVRALVRQAIARHMGSQTEPLFQASPAVSRATWATPPQAAPDVLTLDISHARFHLVRPAGEVECLIEPAVACTHCGFCQTYGH